MDRALILLAIALLIVAGSALVRATVGRRRRIDRIAPDDFSPGAKVILFTSPYCHGCRQWRDALAEDGIATEAIDIAERPDAAAAYRISSTPRLVAIDSSGTVLGDFGHHAPRRSDLDRIARLTSAI